MTGVLLVEGERIHTSLTNWTVRMKTVKNCRDWCQSTKGCVAWSFYTGNKNLGAVEYCVLLKTIDCSSLNLRRDWVSGVSTSACKNFS